MIRYVLLTGGIHLALLQRIINVQLWVLHHVNSFFSSLLESFLGARHHEVSEVDLVSAVIWRKTVLS